MKKFIKRTMAIGVIAGLLLEAFPVWALSKDETIYAKLDSDGDVSKVIVSEHLENTDKKETKDRTKLENIENVNGDEKHTLDNGKLIWESNGKDIYYQGTTRDQLPVTLKMSYYLNGSKTTIANMLGKKGTVKIVLKYSNNDKHTVNVNGKNETLYTPFVIATTSVIPNTTNKNIKVTNGKVITNGTSSVVVALSTPGLYESLGMDKLKDMDTVEITYDTDNFELNSIYSVATPKLIEESDLEMLDNIDSIYGSINTLVNSSKKLKNGSGQLLQGANQLKTGVDKLVEGIHKAYTGSDTITNLVSNSLTNLKNDNSEAIDEETLAYIKQSAINGSKDAAVEAAKQAINAKFTNEYKAAIGNQAVQGLQSNETYQNLKTQKSQLEQAGIPSLVQVCTQETIPEQYLEACQNNKEYIAKYPTLVQMITLMEETARNTAINTAYQTALSTAEQIAASISENVAGKVSVNVAKQVATNAKDQAKKTTTESLTPLLNGLKQLTSGLKQIDSNMSILKNGTQTLKDGISALDSGISQFNTQGIDKISSLVNGDLKSLEGKVKALGKLSTSYGTFDDKEGNTEGSSKIIMVVDAVKANTNTIINNDKISEEKESLWDKIKGLFK
jgi:putative membrane protein